MNPHYLQMWGIPDQVPNRGSVTCSYTADQREGINAAAASLFRLCGERLQSQPLDRSSAAAMDGLNAGALVGAAVARMANVPSLNEEQRDEPALRARQRSLKELLARTSSRLLQEVRREVAAAVQEPVERMRESLLASFGRCPKMAQALIADVQRLLGEVDWPADSSTPRIRRLATILGKLSDLPPFEDRLTESAYRRVAQDLVQLGWQEAEGALEEVLRSLAAEEWLRQMPLLLEFLRELDHRALAFDERLHKLNECLAEHSRAVREQQDERAASIALLLEGPPSEEVIAGMKTASQCEDLTALALKLQAEWDLAVRAAVEKVHPHLDRQASLPSLVLDLPPEALVAAWMQVFERRLGEGHSLYARIRRVGVAGVAADLWRRASPTCFFEGRDHDLFGMNLMEVAVVRLPPAASPEDERTRTATAEQFRKQSKTCQVSRGSPGESEISVVRINCGFVIGIEAANRALLQSYGEAAGHSHPVHLVGLMPDSPLGAASPGCLALLTQDDMAPSNRTTENPRE